jgi:hypothetical protein
VPPVQRFESFSLVCVLGRVLLLSVPNSGGAKLKSIRDELAVPCFCAAYRHCAIGGNPQTDLGDHRCKVAACGLGPGSEFPNRGRIVAAQPRCSRLSCTASLRDIMDALGSADLRI